MLAPKALLFDLDNTLLDHTSAEKQAKRIVYETYFQSIIWDRFEERFDFHNARIWEQISKQEITPKMARTDRFERTIMDLDLGDLPVGEISEYYLQTYSRFWAFSPHAEEVLQALYPKYRLGTITNGFTDVQMGKIRHFGLDRLFSVIALSDEVGIMKPQKGIFDYACSQLKLLPVQCVFIGDIYEVDIVGANQAGWKSVFYNPGDVSVAHSVADWEIRSLVELKDLFD